MNLKKIRTGQAKAAGTVSVGLHNIKPPAGAHKGKRILGRGPSSGHGKTSTRGSKGQTSRAGRHMYPGFEGGQMPLIRKVPKRGFFNISRKEYQTVNLGDLGRVKDDVITPDLLKEKGFIKSKERPVKVLGDGQINRPLVIRVHAVSHKAAAKIATAGGKIEILNA